MREHFKSATLLTSRSVNHGLNVARDSHLTVDQRCLSNIFRYLKNGEIDFTDGKVCEVSISQIEITNDFTSHQTHVNDSPSP